MPSFTGITTRAKTRFDLKKSGKHNYPTERTNPSQQPLEPKSQVSKIAFSWWTERFLPIFG